MKYKIYIFYAPLTEHSFMILKNGEYYYIDNQSIIDLAWKHPDFDNTIIRMTVEDLYVVETDANTNKPVVGWKAIHTMGYVAPKEFKANGFGLDDYNQVDILNKLLNYALSESYDLKPYDAFMQYFSLT